MTALRQPRRRVAQPRPPPPVRRGPHVVEEARAVVAAEHVHRAAVRERGVHRARRPRRGRAHALPRRRRRARRRARAHRRPHVVAVALLAEAADDDELAAQRHGAVLPAAAPAGSVARELPRRARGRPSATRRARSGSRRSRRRAGRCARRARPPRARRARATARARVSWLHDLPPSSLRHTSPIDDTGFGSPSPPISTRLRSTRTTAWARRGRQRAPDEGAIVVHIVTQFDASAPNLPQGWRPSMTT